MLFVCTQNQLRSPTAKEVFANRVGFEVKAAGSDRSAATPVTPELIEWADVIFVMEESHRNKLSQRFYPQLRDKRVICLEIPDQFAYMDPKLIALLEAKCGGFFRPQ